MDTRRNLAKVFAQALRASTADLRRLAWRVDATAAAERANALASIDTVAAELEAVAAGRDLRNPPASPPDPAEAPARD
jgi:hypothetical protein